MEKHIEYTIKIQQAISDMLEEDEQMLEELSEDANATAFIHAAATMVPCNMYNKMTNESLDVLAFNHIANRLCFQFSKKEE